MNKKNVTTDSEQDDEQLFCNQCGELLIGDEIEMGICEECKAENEAED